jgi:7,8-dihydropterin-6-yl-methyl-4-(beta-D-ribofuranosyl)aminobenzene 5'-phosphate synthase
MDLKILYDNEAQYGFRKRWGFSCLVGDELLFDTGGDVSTLLFNMHRFAVDLSRIKEVVLSHEHGDHVGGIDVVEDLGEVNVFVPRSFSPRFKRDLTSHTRVTLVEVGEAMAVAERIFTTGELGSFVKEQSLVVKTGQGVTVITGCSHPGLTNILRKASQFGEIHGVVGGFHGFSQFDALRDMKLIAPCHCTRHKSALFSLYPASCLPCSAGCVLNI